MSRIGLLLVGMLLAACTGTEAPTRAVPVGDRGALEHLATEYTKLAENVPVSPRRLSPEQRKDFVVKVFAASGYSYSSTLHQMAQGGWDANDQNAKDLVELLFMPHSDINPAQGLKGVYSDQELADVRKVQQMMP